MSKAVVGSLRVDLGLNSAQFTEGLTKAQIGLQRFSGLAKTGALAIAGAMVAAGGAVALAMKGIIDRADEMSKLSQSIGIPIADLSRLGYAADLAGVDMEGLEKGVKRLSVSMLDASQNIDGAAAQSFTALGLSVQDAQGDLRTVPDMVATISDRFAAMPDGVEKTAMAMRIFGKSGADLIPLLNGGSAALREAYAEAEQLGIVLDERTGKAAEAFNDNLTRLGVVKDGIVTRITAGMLPALLQLSESMVGAAKNSDAMRIVGAALGWTLNSLVTVAVTVGAAFIGVASDIGAAWDAANRFVRMDFSGGVAAFRAGTSRTQTLLRGAETFVRDLWRPPSGPPPATQALNTGLALIPPAARAATQQVERLTDAEREAQRAAEEMTRSGQQTFEQTRTAAEQYAARVAELNRQLAAAAINQDTFNRAMRDAKDAFDASDPKTAMRQQLADAARDARAENKEDAIRLAADHEKDMRDATYDGISEGLHAAADGTLLEYLKTRMREALFDSVADSLTNLIRPAGGKKGGGILSSLTSMLGSLRLPGFKTGGSFKVGGSGGADSQMMAFRATPGEMVDIRRPGQDAGGGALAVHVNPSPYFDVRVERVAGPLAAQAGLQGFSAARSQVPADLAKNSRYRTR
ncbi:hypothetical protein [Brevundimonas sp. TWP2-3-4b1]|uniref:hypothetical protein n=1 Tax=Brevundimonas sp. TWP2-3-4b1 TaxID=2804580 RepID=UPI003CF050CA